MKAEQIILEAWESYKNKTATELLTSENEKMMQLQLAQILQALCPVYEYGASESLKVLLEVPVRIRGTVFRSIDIVVSHTFEDETTRFPIELKCFRLMTRDGTGRRGAQNLGMYDYWEDIENIENYCQLPNYGRGFQFTMTDDPYYVNTAHRGAQVATYSTNCKRSGVTGRLQQIIANRRGDISLYGSYCMSGWQKLGSFYFIAQKTAHEMLLPKSDVRDVLQAPVSATVSR